MLSAVPAEAHVFTKNDANDSASKIDLRSVSVSHTSTSVVHRVRTWNSWTPASLQHDSFFWFGINKDSDSGYERCAFVYYTSRLRGQLSNCKAQFIRFLPVAKIDATTAKITIPKAQLGPVYTWFGGSAWLGATPCRNVCFDFAPNRLPDLLHDLKPPISSMSQDLIQTWDESTTMTFPLAFTVFDGESGLDHWSVQKRPLEVSSGIWTTVLTGSASGSLMRDIESTGGRFAYRVVASDRQGNTKASAMRVVYEATDVDELLGPGTFDPAATPVANAEAFGGDYVPLDDAGDSYEWTFVSPNDGIDRLVKFIGPGIGDWVVERFTNGVSNGTISAASITDAQRQVFSEALLGSTEDVTFRFELVSGTGFGIDAVLI